MARMPDHPNPVSDWADHNSVCMRDTDGNSSVIDTKPNELSAAKSARMWQKRENAAVEKARKKLIQG